MIKDASDKDMLKGKDMFDISSFVNPQSRPYFLKFISELKASCDAASPSDTHHFMKRLSDLGLLLRSYTQNIDDLERRAGLRVFDGGVETVVESVGVKKRESLGGAGLPARPNVIPLHGTLSTLVCTVCRYRVSFGESAVAQYEKGKVVACQKCQERSNEREQRGRRRLQSGIYRPDIVLYNEHHPQGDLIAEFVSLDLDVRPSTVIVMGTSLRIPGLKRLVKDMAKAVQRKRQSGEDRAGHVIFINRTPASRAEWKGVFDAELLGDCDKWVNLLSRHMEDFISGRPRSALQFVSPSKEQAKITSFFKTTAVQPGKGSGKKAQSSGAENEKGILRKVDPLAALRRCSVLG